MQIGITLAHINSATDVYRTGVIIKNDVLAH